MHFTTLPSLLAAARNDREDEDFQFDKSLRELKDLRSQLHYAADDCLSTYLNAPDKNVVLENTKEYLCRAVVTLVDHLGTVSTNLDSCISKTSEISDAEFRLDCVLQRLLSCEKYAHKLALTHVRWSVKMPRHHPRYTSTSITTADGMTEVRSCASKPKTLQYQLLGTEENSPQSLSADTKVSKPEMLDKNDTAKITRGHAVLPIRDSLSILPKGPNPTFNFQLCSQKSRRRRTLLGSDTDWLQGTEMPGHRQPQHGSNNNFLYGIGTKISGGRRSLQGAETNLLQSTQKPARRRSLQGADIVSLIWRAKA